MAPVAMQCFYSMRAAKARLDGEPEPMLDRRRHGSDEMWRLNIGTCHVWAPDGDAVAARLTGIPEPAPVFLRGRLERLGLRMTDGSETDDR